ncbi:MAG TPA: glucosyl-3-phosphoglycerate synthase [Acidimicrobiales bacterium]|nr:glucosyl-3-phosphoglycerate synthase [Acidimicrobiales bacterium]
MLRRFDWRSFSAPLVMEAKAARGATISVCIPAFNEEATIGDVVSCIGEDLMSRHHLVDELLVVDDGSTDATAKEAETAGATVLSLAVTSGKGEAMRQGLLATSGDIVMYCDGDIYDFSARFVLGLTGPLLTEPGTALVKGAYRRPLDGQVGEGGRVTELVAKPLIGLYFPELSALRQPLAGEAAAWRGVLSGLTYEDGYGVELGMLIDVAREYGPDAIAESDLGERRHRNRPLAELAPQAATVMRVGLQRAGVLKA